MAFHSDHHSCHKLGTAVNRFHLPDALSKPLFVVELFANDQAIVLALAGA